MSKSIKTHPCYCYGLILRDNLIKGELIPAFIVCWDTRAHDDKQVFTLKRIHKVRNPVVTTTPEDIYELKVLYRRFRFSIRDKKHRPRKTFIHGILVACRCNDDATEICGPYVYISNVNDKESTKLKRDSSLKRWQDVYLEKEKRSYMFDLADIVCSEEGIMISQDVPFGIYGGN